MPMIIASTVTDLATLITAVGSLVTAIGILLTRRAVKDVKAEVATGNGITAGVLLDRQEGRRIEADVPHGDRTSSEQGYVDKLHGPTDRKGNPISRP